MAATRKYFFGSLFSFQPVAIEELRSRFQEAFKNNRLPGLLPLLSYDQRIYSFSIECECEKSVVKPAQIFRDLLAQYIANHQHERDLLENQRIVPIDGTFINDPTVSNELFSLEDDDGLLPLSDSEGSDREGGTSGRVGYPTEMWKPAFGNVEILTLDVVKALSDRTGCTFSINSYRNEVRIHGGQVREALSKLKSLESILTLLHTCVNKHVLVLSTANEDTRIDFTLPSDNALRRIIVDPDVKSVKIWLGNKCIEQLAYYTKGAEAKDAFTTPKNLTTPMQYSSGVEPSSIWSDFRFSEVGNIKNRASVGIPSMLGKIENYDPLPISHYMTEKEAHLIEQWAGRVIESTEHSKATMDSPTGDGNQEKPAGRTRVKKANKAEGQHDGEDEKEMADESDFDDDSLKNGWRSKISVRINPGRSINDALNTQLDAMNLPVGRARVRRKADDDDSEEDEDMSKDDFSGKPSNSDTEEHHTWSYPPASQPKVSDYHGRASAARIGRKRVLKAQSDDENKGDDWSSLGSDELEFAKHHAASPSEATLPRSIYPGSSYSDGLGSSSRRGPELSVQPVQNTSRTYPCLEPVPATSPMPAVKQQSDFATSGSQNDFYNGIQREGQVYGKGKGDGGQDQTLPRAELTSRAAPRGTHEPTHAGIPQRASSPPRSDWSRRDQRNDSTTIAPRSTAPASVSNTSKSNQFAGKQNPFSVLEVETLIDTSDLQEFDAETTASEAAISGYHEADRRLPQESASHSGSISTAPRETLIDLATTEGPTDSHVRPPPGFDTSWRTRSPTHNHHGSPFSLSDYRRSPSSSTPGSMPLQNTTGNSYLSSHHPDVDLTQTSSQELDQFSEGRQSPKSSTEMLQGVDEASTRTYHRTMSQCAGKPEKGKKEIRERHAETLKSAWGPSQSAGQSKATNTTSADSSAQALQNSDMSAAKRKLLRQQASTPSTDAIATYQEQSLQRKDQFIAAFESVLDAARSFPGVLKFEIQLGQFLSPSPDGAYQAKCVTVNQWHKLYDPVKGRLAAAATFTNILTRNGADVDQILKLKMGKGGRTNMFHLDDPGRVDVRFEFDCRGKNNDEFKLVLDSEGRYLIERPFRTIGQVNLHIPGQIWDSAGLLTGSMRACEDRPLKTAFEELARSLYIRGAQENVEISYRPPTSNEFAVKKVLMRRVSHHTCAIPEKSDVQLHITEVQRLFVECCSNGIYLAYAAQYEKMVDQMMVHFEVSLVSQSISQALSANRSLVVGDVITAWTAESILQPSRIQNLLETTLTMVSKIDGVGFHNVGSAVFFLGRESVLAPGSMAGAPTPNTGIPYKQQQNQNRYQPQNHNENQQTATLQNSHSAALINVPGVRGGVAQAATAGYAVGYGGARVPLGPHPTAEAPAGSAVVPDDSVSQAADEGSAGPRGQVMPGFW